MHLPRLQLVIVAVAASLVLAACGGGGSNPDISPSDPPVATSSGPDSFLLFPNPQLQPDGTLQTNTVAYAQAYYADIDPGNARSTVDKWKAANGFDRPGGTQTTVVFGDVRDLGYGRRMTARQNADGTIAFLVENYLVSPGGAYGYSPLSLEAAIRQDTRWRIHINAIEFSPARPGGAAFAKFFTFNGATGEREVTVDLDGCGAKAMPGPCISCHGGRADALTPPDKMGRVHMSIVPYTRSQAPGDTAAQLAPLEVDKFDFSTLAGFTRAEQEAAFKALNRLVLCTYPIQRNPPPASFPEDQCRPSANDSEWQGTAATLLKAAYGGDGLPGATFTEPATPPEWATEAALYRDVVVPSCRTCHLLRGTQGQSDIDFTSSEKFAGYADRIKTHVFDRGNMPLAKLVFDAFWASGSPQPDAVANFLVRNGIAASDVHDASGAVLRPGRPIADPGPDRVVPPGPTRLSGAASLFANAYAWSIVSGPAGASLSDATSVQPTFTGPAGTYTLQLVVSSGGVRSAPARFTIVVDNGITIPRFVDVKAVLQGVCASCHNAETEPIPGVLYGDAQGNDIDRDGDTVVDANDNLWFLAAVRSRINFTDIVASPLLRKPAGQHHGGALQPNFELADETQDPPKPRPVGAPERADYDLFVRWIVNGAPL